MPDSIGGLPLHPLIVHGAVVLLPLAALGAVAIVLFAPLRRRYGLLVLAAVLSGTACAVLAAATGGALAAEVGFPATHAMWGGRLRTASLVFSALTVGWFLLRTRAGRDGRGGRDAPGRPGAPGPAAPTGVLWAARALGAATVVAALACLVLTVVTGHSGATAVWGSVAGPGPVP